MTTPTAEVAAFDLTAPLPTGTTLLEASAGTGKTFAIAALATRYIAEGRATIDQVLMITFGRAATRELRERVREALTRARDALRGPDAATSDDPVIALLAAAPHEQRIAAATRLATAVADFDSATIATTHQFCQHALRGLGIAADLDPGETFVEDISTLVDEVVEDFYVRKYGAGAIAADQQMSLAEARSIASAAVNDPQSLIHEGGQDLSPGDAARVRYARAVRDEVHRRRRARRLVTFDDLVLRLDLALQDPVTGAQACELLRRTYAVVLVDEFQDTDPAQWRIVSTAFHGQCTLVLIGDPKQAIYAFRGADVFSYLEAAGVAEHRATLQANYRSDAPVVDGIAALLGGLELGDPRIAVGPVTASRPKSRLSGMDSPNRVRLRLVPAQDGVAPPVAQARGNVAADVAADVVRLLSGPARLERGDGPLRSPGAGPILPADIAVLVATNRQGDAAKAALGAVGVPSVVSAPHSVFATPAAKQWQTLLRAIESPRRTTIRDAALTDFLGRTARELALDGEALDEEVGLQVRSWGRILESDGMAALMVSLSAQTGLMPRVLSRPDGERHLTDIRHIAAALHSQQRAARCGVIGLLDWLDEQAAHGSQEGSAQATDRTRRLDTDAAAVQILTVHRSKGLEFPIVYVPFGWDRYVGDPDLVRCHLAGKRVLDVRSRSAPGRQDLLAAMRAEDAGEDLRLLYVALTRAASLVVAHWAPGPQNTAGAPLTRVLFAKASGETAPKAMYRGNRPPLEWLSPPGSGESPLVSVEEVPADPSTMRWAGSSGTAATMAVAPYTRDVDTVWRRTSYTGLTSALHGAGSQGAGSDGAGSEEAPPEHRTDEPEGSEQDGTEPNGTQQVDIARVRTEPVRTEPDGAQQEGASRSGLAHIAGPDVVSAFADLPAGASFGTLVHSVIESVDTGAPDLAHEVARRCAEAVEVRPLPGLAAEPLAAAVLAAMRTPLGPLASGLTLADIPPTDRLAELDFELPMGGSRTSDGPATLAELCALMRGHLRDSDPLQEYPDRLLASGIGWTVLRGYLAGSIDAVLRVRDGAPFGAGTAGKGPALEPPNERMLVVDYKSNLLRTPGAEGLERLAWSYRPSRLPEAMMQAHYPLQALLYSAALHRYLRWRLPGYDPSHHLGGVLYLFLRGMTGPGAPAEDGLSCGVFSWQPPADLVVALSDLLDGRRT